MPDLGWLAFDSLGLRVVLLCALSALCMAWGAWGTARLLDYYLLTVLLIVVAIATVGATVTPLFYFLWEIVAFVGWGLGRWAASRHRQTMMGALPLQGFGALGSLGMAVSLLMMAMVGRTLSVRGSAPDDLRPFMLLMLGALVLKSFALLSPAWYPSRDERSFYVAHGTLGTAGLLIVGVYPYLRFFSDNLAYRSEWRDLAVWVGLGLAFLSATAALGQRDLHKLLALATFSQFAGLIAFSAALRPGESALVTISLLAYTFGIAGLSLALSAVGASTGQRDLRQLGGLGNRMPVTAGLFLLCSLALAGLPPFAGFTGRLFAGIALFGRDQSAVAELMLALGVITLLYLLRAFRSIFLGMLPRGQSSVREGPLSILTVVSALIIGLLLAGLWTDRVLNFIRPAVELNARAG